MPFSMKMRVNRRKIDARQKCKWKNNNVQSEMEEAPRKKTIQCRITRQIERGGEFFWGVRKQIKRKYSVTSLRLDINHVLNKMIGECLLQDFGLSEVYFLWPKAKRNRRQRKQFFSFFRSNAQRWRMYSSFGGFVMMKHSSFLAIFIALVVSVLYFFFHRFLLPRSWLMKWNKKSDTTMYFLSKHTSCKHCQWQQIVWREKTCWATSFFCVDVNRE